MVATAAAAAGLWYGWRWYTTPVPPELPGGVTDPAVIEVVEEARREVLRHPRSAEAWGDLGMVLRAHEFRDLSKDCFAQAERLDPRDPRWPYLQGLLLLDGKPEGALPFLRRAVELCQRGEEYEVAARLRLAETLLDLGLYPEAEEQLHRVEALAPDYGRVHFDLGTLAAARGALAEARKHLALAARSRLVPRKAHAQLATVCQQLGDDRAAATHARLAAAAPPDLLWPDPFVEEVMKWEVGRRHRLQQVEQLESERRMEEAISILRDLLRQSPDAQSYLLLGMYLGRARDFAEAEEMLRHALRQSPDKLQACYFLGLTLYTQGEALLRQPDGRKAAQEKFREAAHWERRATELKADHGLAHVYLGKALQRLGQQAEALKALRAAVRCRPEFVDTHLALGEALAEAGQEAEARSHLQDALRLAPANDPRPREALARLGQAGKNHPR
jgi:tetratricopeptide (TPR) repeat protein